MLAAALAAASSSSAARLRVAASLAKRATQAQQLRWLNIHEYQGAKVMAARGVNVPPGIPVFALDQVPAAVKAMASPEEGDNQVVVKSQILAGGRGLGTFKESGFKGGVHVCDASEAPAVAAKMLGGTLVTKQTGPAGKPVNALLVAKKLKLTREMYLAILLDRKAAGPVLVACSEGGTSIEDLAEAFPDKIRKIAIDPRKGLTDEQASEAVDALGIKDENGSGKKKRADAVEQVKALYRTFSECDCTMVEVNPLAETADGRIVAADAKLGFDDSAGFRQKEIFAMRDSTQEDPREVAAAKYDLNYIGLDGNIGCMVNGAGLAMATMDIIKLHGGAPANFLDVGGNASEEQVVEAFKILTADPTVKALLVNIFGGIMKCDVIAAGIVNAARQVGVEVPLVVRLEGTNVEKGKQILASSGINVISADDLDDAACKAVAAIK